MMLNMDNSVNGPVNQQPQPFNNKPGLQGCLPEVDRHQPPLNDLQQKQFVDNKEWLRISWQEYVGRREIALAKIRKTYKDYFKHYQLKISVLSNQIPSKASKNDLNKIEFPQETLFHRQWTDGSNDSDIHNIDRRYFELSDNSKRRRYIPLMLQKDILQVEDYLRHKYRLVAYNFHHQCPHYVRQDNTIKDTQPEDSDEEDGGQPDKPHQVRLKFIKSQLFKYQQTRYTAISDLKFLYGSNWILDKDDHSKVEHQQAVCSNQFIPPRLNPQGHYRSIELKISSQNINFRNSHDSRVNLNFRHIIEDLKIRQCQVIFFQEVDVQVQLTQYNTFRLPYDNNHMIDELSKYSSRDFSEEELSKSKSGGLLALIKSDVVHNDLGQEFQFQIYFNQVFRISNQDGNHAVIINTYIFPDAERKFIVHMEIDKILNTIRTMYANPQIIIVGDFNQNLLNQQQLQVMLPGHKYHHNLELPNERIKTHRSAMIDFYLQQNMSVQMSTLTNKFTDSGHHHNIILTTNTTMNMYENRKPLTSTKRINNYIKERPFRAFSDRDVQNFQSKIIRALDKPQELKDIYDYQEKIRQAITNNNIYEEYLEQLQISQKEIPYIKDPQQQHALIKRICKFRKQAVIVNQIRDGQKVLNEQETFDKILKMYKSLYSLDKDYKVTNECRPAGLLVTMQDLIRARKRIGPYKATADNMIPSTSIHIDENLLYLALQITNICARNFPSQIHFQSRMLFFNKLVGQPDIRNIEKAGKERCKPPTIPQRVDQDQNLNQNQPPPPQNNYKNYSIIPSANQLRPISITTMSQKVIERIMLPKLKPILANLNPGQIGFIPGQETNMHIMRILQILNHRRNEGCLSSELLFVDISKAFDSMRHDLIMEAFSRLGLGYYELNMLTWYFNQLGVNIGENRIPINSSGPQGGVLSPLMWIAFFDSMIILTAPILRNRQWVTAYADDIAFVCTSSNQVNQVVITINDWADKNHIKINYEYDKTVRLLIKHKYRKQYPDYQQQISTKVIAQDDYRYLGFIMNSKLDFPLFRFKRAYIKAQTVRLMRINIKTKVSIMQSYLISQYRFLLQGIFLLKNPEKIYDQIQALMMRVIKVACNLSLTTSIQGVQDKNNLFRKCARDIIFKQDRRVLNKLEFWEERTGGDTDWLHQFGQKKDMILCHLQREILEDKTNQYLIYPGSEDFDRQIRTWEIDEDDSFWFKIVNEGKYFFADMYCSACNQFLYGLLKHISTCLYFKPKRQKIIKEARSYDTNDDQDIQIILQEHNLDTLFAEPMLLNVIKNNFKRIAFKRILNDIAYRAQHFWTHKANTNRYYHQALEQHRIQNKNFNLMKRTFKKFIKNIKFMKAKRERDTLKYVRLLEQQWADQDRLNRRRQRVALDPLPSQLMIDQAQQSDGEQPEIIENEIDFDSLLQSALSNDLHQSDYNHIVQDDEHISISLSDNSHPEVSSQYLDYADVSLLIRSQPLLDQSQQEHHSQDDNN